jgi:N-acetylmuramoyl-L-alanine amidase
MPDLTHPSPHHNARPSGAFPRILVLHSDAGKSDRGTLDWLAHPDSKVSYHGLVGRQGRYYTCVELERRAWHAGVAKWQNVSDVNGWSIGVAFCNAHDGVEALTPGQMAVMLGVVEGLARTVLTLEAVTTHAAIAPGRKTDPLNSVGFQLADYELAFSRGVGSR